MLGKIPFVACLDVCSRLIQVLEFGNANHEEKERLFKEVFSPEVGARYEAFLAQKPTEQAVLMHPFPLLFLIKAGATFSPREPVEVDLSQYANDLVRLVFAVWGHLNRKAEGYIRQDADAVIYAMAQRSMMARPPMPWARAHGLYDDARPSVLLERTDALAEIGREFRAASGLSIRELIQGTSLIHWFYQDNSIEQFVKNGRPLIPETFPANKAGKLIIGKVAGQLSCPIEQLCSECSSERQPDGGITESLVALKRHPLVELAAGYQLCVSPNLVAEAAIERPIRSLETNAIGRGDMGALNEIRRKFGVIFEDYVHWLFRTQFPQNYFLIGRDERAERADGAIIDPKGIVIVECKAQRLVESRRYEISDYAAALEGLRRLKIEKAASQILATAKGLIRGELRLDGIRLTLGCPIGSLIVAYEDQPVSSTTDRLFSPILFQTQRFDGHLILQPQIIDVAEAEELRSIRGNHTLLELLLRKDRDRKYGRESLRLYAQKALGARTSWDHNRVLAKDFLEKHLVGLLAEDH